MTQLTHGSLFAGIGGFDAGFRESGMQVKWQVEREPFCRAILRTRFPEAELLNDVRECGKHNLGAVDVLTAGFPCQDLSVAGKRAGLAGSRSGLFWEVVRILGELRPAWFVLENVPGLFSSNEGRDFAVVLESLDELGYGLAWRVLDSQFFGVAQRRRRVFIVGSFGKPCPAEVLFESEGGEGDFAQGGETGTGVADETCDRVASPIRHNDGGSDGGGPRGGYGENLVAYGICGDATDKIGYNIQPTLRGRETGGGFQQCVAHQISASAGHHGHSIPRGDGSDNIIVQQAISAKWSKGSSGPAGDEHHNLTVVNCLAPVGGGADDNDAQAGHIVLQDVREIEKGQHGLGIDIGGPAPTLGLAERHGVAFSPTPNSNRVRDFAGLPLGLDSARYRALGNAVTAKVAFWIGRRIVACHERQKELIIEVGEQEETQP